MACLNKTLFVVNHKTSTTVDSTKEDVLANKISLLAPSSHNLTTPQSGSGPETAGYLTWSSATRFSALKARGGTN